MATTKPITARTRIQLRWTTDPSYFGYGSKKDIANVEVDRVSTPRLILEEMQDVRQKVGHGVEILFHLRVAATGEVISRYDLESVVNALENR